MLIYVMLFTAVPLVDLLFSVDFGQHSILTGPDLETRAIDETRTLCVIGHVSIFGHAGIVRVCIDLYIVERAASFAVIFR